MRYGLAVWWSSVSVLVESGVCAAYAGCFEGGERDGKAHIVRVDGRHDLSKGKALVDHRLHFWIDVGDYFCLWF